MRSFFLFCVLILFSFFGDALVLCWGASATEGKPKQVSITADLDKIEYSGRVCYKENEKKYYMRFSGRVTYHGGSRDIAGYSIQLDSIEGMPLADISPDGWEDVLVEMIYAANLDIQKRTNGFVGKKLTIHFSGREQFPEKYKQMYYDSFRKHLLALPNKYRPNNTEQYSRKIVMQRIVTATWRDMEALWLNNFMEKLRKKFETKKVRYARYELVGVDLSLPDAKSWKEYAALPDSGIMDTNLWLCISFHDYGEK